MSILIFIIYLCILRSYIVTIEWKTTNTKHSLVKKGRLLSIDEFIPRKVGFVKQERLRKIWKGSALVNISAI